MPATNTRPHTTGTAAIAPRAATTLTASADPFNSYASANPFLTPKSVAGRTSFRPSWRISEQLDRPRPNSLDRCQPLDDRPVLQPRNRAGIRHRPVGSVRAAISLIVRTLVRDNPALRKSASGVASN